MVLLFPVAVIFGSTAWRLVADKEPFNAAEKEALLLVAS
jgi:hypothetical protein